MTSGQRTTRCILGIICGLSVIAFQCIAAADASNDYYTEEHVYLSRPKTDSEMSFGHIGVTGLKVRIYRGVVVKVEGTEPNTPAAGKFKTGDIITGINNEALKGRNPFVLLGSALTKAEGTDGAMLFDVQDGKNASPSKVAVTIPVLGAYGATWPLHCNKSSKIIQQAAEYYATSKEFKNKYFAVKGIGGALACLFLLSTGDDKYIPCVKEYFAQFLPNTKAIGDHTWNNGYNGIACAEYYLRTGDKDVLPILEHFCEDAKSRQKFGCSWTHWGLGVNPRYVAGGLMNPAGAQVLTTLLMSQECGVAVDEKTLMGALRFWYRFAGHGTVPYGDHRPEGGLGSNGKDGMGAAAMIIASGAQGDTTSYKKAKEYYSMSMLDSYPVLVQGHGDDGMGDAIWRGLTSSYLMESKSAEYRQVMQRLEWWYDLSRRPSGALGNATCQREEFDDEGTGAAVALSYTAPLKTLRITGAPRSPYAKDFTLPKLIWGRPADLAFLSIADHPMYGASEPTHIPFWKYGGAYHKSATDLKTVPRSDMLKNVYHRNYMIRVQAAKALRIVGALDELEKLLRDPDPRIRRAGLDGIMDYNYWFGMGRQTLKATELTPGMLEAIKKMLADPNEALWVVDGALMALSLAPAPEIQGCLPLIMPWTTHDDWWLRESSFMALLGLQKDDALLVNVVPTLLTMMVNEYHTMPRERFTSQMQEVLKKNKATSTIGQLIVAGLKRAVNESEVKTGERSGEGSFNVESAAKACLKQAPEATISIAKAMRLRFPLLNTGQIISLAASPHSIREGHPFGLYTMLGDLLPDQRQELTDILTNDYRSELVKRLKSESGDTQALIDSILDLAQLKNSAVGWKVIGKPRREERPWHYLAFDPQPADLMAKREKHRFRDIKLPGNLEKWYTPDFNDSTWETGKSPIGIGTFKQGNVSFKNNSEWGSGEFLLARTVFELDALDCDIYRLNVLAAQGFHVYLNGYQIASYEWWKDLPHYQVFVLKNGDLRKGANTIAVYCNVEYKNEEPFGQIDMFIEGLSNKDLE